MLFCTTFFKVASIESKLSHVKILAEIHSKHFLTTLCLLFYLWKKSTFKEKSHETMIFKVTSIESKLSQTKILVKIHLKHFLKIFCSLSFSWRKSTFKIKKITLLFDVFWHRRRNSCLKKKDSVTISIWQHMLFDANF